MCSSPGNFEICTDIRTDSQNCGGCGLEDSRFICTGESTCQNGSRSCEQGKESCNGQCVDQCPSGTVRNPDDCSCQCQDPTKVLVNGQCQCPAGTTDCGEETGQGACKDLTHDPNACGGCGFEFACRTDEVCNQGQCGWGPGTQFSSTFNKCVPICEGNQINLPPDGICRCDLGPGTFTEKCGIMCVDTASDENNCGGCFGVDGEKCESGEVCQAGSCTCPSGTHFDSTFNNCVPDCTGDLENLPPNGDCACPSLPGGTPTQCSDSCVDTNTNEDNCGSCGNSCPAGETCQNGSCTTGPPGMCPESYVHPPLSEPSATPPFLGCPGPNGVGTNTGCHDVGGGDYYCVYGLEDGKRFICYYHVDESQGVERYTLCGEPF